jgi:hypothetical protein
VHKKLSKRNNHFKDQNGDSGTSSEEKYLGGTGDSGSLTKKSQQSKAKKFNDESFNGYQVNILLDDSMSDVSDSYFSIQGFNDI